MSDFDDQPAAPAPTPETHHMVEVHAVVAVPRVDHRRGPDDILEVVPVSAQQAEGWVQQALRICFNGTGLTGLLMEDEP